MCEEYHLFVFPLISEMNAISGKETFHSSKCKTLHTLHIYMKGNKKTKKN